MRPRTDPSGRVLSVVLPVLNEKGSLRRLLPELLAGLSCLREVIVVDDGSTDGTAALVDAFARRDERVRWLPRAGRPRSLTASLRDGFAEATGELIGWMDADGTMTARDLERLRAAIERGADLAVGSRFTAGGGMKGQVDGSLLSSVRELGNSRDAVLPVALSWAFNVVLIPLLLRRRPHDYTSGFAVARRELLEAVELSGEHGEYFLRLFVAAEARGYRVVELPYKARPRREGESKTVVRWRDYMVRARQYLGAAWHARHDR